MMPERFNYVEKDRSPRRSGRWIARTAVILAIGAAALFWERASHGEGRGHSGQPSGELKREGAPEGGKPLAG